MNNVKTIQTKLDSNLLAEAENVLERLGMTTTQAIRMFLVQVGMKKRLPFNVALNNQYIESDQRANIYEKNNNAFNTIFQKLSSNTVNDDVSRMPDQKYSEWWANEIKPNIKF